MTTLHRRHFTQAAIAAGASSALIGSAAWAQPATPEPSPVAVASGRPAFGTESQERGAGGELRLLVWQAPSVAAPHSGSGDKDFIAAALVVEPLLQTTDEERATEILIALNDLVVTNVAQIPLVQRTDAPYVLSNRLRPENMAIGPRFAISTWNIANWNAAE